MRRLAEARRLEQSTSGDAESQEHCERDPEANGGDAAWKSRTEDGSARAEPAQWSEPGKEGPWTLHSLPLPCYHTETLKP